MRRSARRSAVLALLGLLASLLAVSAPSVANAAESIPELQWPPAAVNASQYRQMVTGPQGDVTIGCDWLPSTAQDLITYDAAGNVVRQIDSRTRVDETTNQIDGKNNCITQPVVDKIGDVYGVPYTGTKLLAYNGNTLKWKYPVGCVARPVVGADGNIYFIAANNRLIGLKPNLESGQTQPTKVLDVPSTHGCGSELRAFKGGFASSQGSSFVYYSTNGTNLGSPPGNYWGDYSFPVNADGRLFYPNWVSGSFKSMWLSAYDPISKTVAFNTQISTPGANTINPFSIHPLPNGGVMAVVREQKMVSDGVPATPTEYVQALVVLTPGGQKLWSKQLLTVDANGNRRVDGPFVTVDAAGRAAVVQVWAKVANQTSKDLFTSIDVIDPISSNAVVPSLLMKGNYDPASGPVYGYRPAVSSIYLTIGANTFYVNAYRCTTGSSCDFSSSRLYAFKVPGLGMDYPRSVFLDAPAPTPYVALGDSFSAGEGLPPFEAGTNTNGTNECHRSTVAYPRLISGTSAKIPSLVMGGFRACSGAVTDHVTTTAQWNEGTQINQYLNKTTKLVTISIGGNDIKFGDFGNACFFGSCAIGSPAYNNSLDKIDNELPGKLEATYKKILQEAPNAKIFVIGYPQVVDYKSPTDPDDSRCFYLQDGEHGSTKWGDARGARDIVTKLNAKISGVVSTVRGQSASNLRLNYVPADGPDSPFNGHEVCGTADSWFLNADQVINDKRYVFHPDIDGQEGYAVIAAAKINNTP